MNHNLPQNNSLISEQDQGGHLTREDLLSCVELGKALTSELDPRRLFGSIMQKMHELLPAQNWSLLLVDEEKDELYFELAVDLDVESLRHLRLRMGEGIAGQAALKQEPLIVDETGRCTFFCDRVDQASGKKTKSVIAVPLIFAGRTVGVIELVNIERLEERTLPLLRIIADYAAIAVENMRRYKKIQELAVRDDLTGLYNTRYLYRTLEEMLNDGSISTLSLIFMDIDNFKKVVDAFGHLKGSKTLQEVAQTIRSSLGSEGFAVAYGGDEFVVVLPNKGKQEALEVAERIRQNISKETYLARDGHNIKITASLGVSSYPEDASDIRGILGLADRLMFQIKASSKNAIKAA